MTSRLEVRKKRDQKLKEGRKRGRDVTRISRLSANELKALEDKVRVVGVNTHDISDERYHCYETDAPVYKKGKLIGVRAIALPLKDLESTEISTFYHFAKGGVMLAAAGKFPHDPMDEVSHLCHNAKCVRPSHLTWESHQNNLKRVNCPGQVRCEHTAGYCNACHHEPRCIKMT
jgi:Zinc-binding loop region of homing endonuclease